MDFKLDINKLEETIDKFNNLLENVSVEQKNAEDAVSTLADEDWEGESRDTFLEKYNEWKTKMNTYIQSVTFMRDTLNNEILPKAKSLNSRCLGFAGLLGGDGCAVGSRNIISLDKSRSSQILNVLNITSKETYESEISVLKQAEEELSRMTFSSFSGLGKISSCKREINEIQQKMDSFHDSLESYNKEVEQLEELMISRMKEIKSPERFKKIIEGGFINDNIADLIKSIEEKTLADKLSFVDAEGRLDDVIATLKGLSERCSLFSKDPVNLSTGNFVFEKIDLVINGKHPLVFKRAYNSIDDREGVFGKDWTHNYEISLKHYNKKVKITFGDGHVNVFEKNEDGSFKENKEALQCLEYIDNKYVLTEWNKDKYYFNDNGQWIVKEDANGNKLILNYENNRLSSVENPCGKLYFEYDEKGNLVFVSDNTGRKINYLFDNGRLTEVTNYNGSSYKYNYNADGKISEIINPKKVRNVYNIFDQHNRTTKQVFPDGGEMKYDYDDKNNRVTLTEQNGNKITYERDTKYRNTKIIYLDGHEEVGYNEQNLKTFFKDKNGNTYKYNYDDKGNLKECLNPLGYKTSYVYNSNRKPIKIKYNNGLEILNSFDEKGNLVETTDSIGDSTKIIYSENGMVNRVIQADGSETSFKYDSKGNTIEIIPPNGSKISYEYDQLNRVIKTIDGNGNITKFEYNNDNKITKVINAEGNFCEYKYDECGNLSKIIDFDGGVINAEYSEINKIINLTDKSGNKTNFEYDIMWNISKIISSNGSEIVYKYDKLNRLKSCKKGSLDEINYEYDSNGNKIKVYSGADRVIRYKYDKINRMIEHIDEEGGSTSYTYDSLNNITEISDSMGNKTVFDYDIKGRLIRKCDSEGNIIEFEYNQLGLIKKIVKPGGRIISYSYYKGGLLKEICYPGNLIESYEYDGNNNIIKKTDKLGRTTRYKYDSLDRIVEVINPLNHSKKYEYDVMGNIIKAIDEEGNATLYKYSLNGQLIQVEDALGNKIDYDYDSIGKLTKVVQYELIDSDIAEAEKINEQYKSIKVTEYKWNENGAVKEIIDPMGNIEAFEYDSVGNLISRTDQNGSISKYKYNKVNSLKEILYGDGRKVEFIYNPLKQLIQVNDWLGTIKINKDSLGRILEVTDENGNNVSYTWGESNEKKSITYPDSSTIEYEYDELLHLTRMKTGNDTISYKYDEIGRMIEKIMPNNLRTKLTYNSLSRVETFKNLKGDNIIDSFVFTYDKRGNKTSVNKVRNDFEEENGLYNYEYDSLNRLISVAKNNEKMREYEYDAFGNRIRMRKDSEVINYSYNSLNQLISMKDSSGELNYNYDRCGKLTEICKNDVVKSKYEYGADGTLRRYSDINGKISEYVYNGLGWRTNQRIYTNDAIKNIEYVLDYTRSYGNILQMKENDICQNYIYDRNIVKSSTAQKEMYYLNDELGSSVSLINSEGNIVNSFDYDEFGIQRSKKIDTDSIFGYTGYIKDEGSSLYYANARYYDALTGRFSSMDKVKGLLKIPATFNSYVYCFNAPMDYIDLNGAWPSLGDVWDGVCDVAGSAVDTLGDCANTAKNAICDVGNSIKDGASYVWNNCIYGEDTITIPDNYTTPKEGIAGVYGSGKTYYTEHTGGSIIVKKTYVDVTQKTVDVGFGVDLGIVNMENTIGGNGLYSSLGFNIFGIKPKSEYQFTPSAEDILTIEGKSSLQIGDSNAYGGGARLGISPSSTLDIFGINYSQLDDKVLRYNEAGVYVNTAAAYAVAAVAAIVILAADDATGIGAIDDELIPGILTFLGSIATEWGITLDSNFLQQITSLLAGCSLAN